MAGGLVGVDAGFDAGVDAGQADAGFDAGTCTPLPLASACMDTSGALCGYVDAGCGTELRCEYCTERTECGVSQPNRCSTPTGLCTLEGWCWEAPLPQGNDIRAVWGTSMRDLWLATANGGVFRWNGERTSMAGAPMASRVDWRSISGRGADVVLGGDNGLVLLRQDGGWFFEQPSTTTEDFVSVVMRPDGTIFAGSTSGNVFERKATNFWEPRGGAGGNGHVRLFMHQGILWAVRGNGRLWRANASGFDEVVATNVPLPETLDPVSLGQEVAVASTSLLPDAGVLVRVFVHSTVTNTPWNEAASVETGSQSRQVGLARRDGGLWLVAARDTIRKIDRADDGGWSLSGPQLVWPAGFSGERTRNYSTAIVFENEVFIGGSDGVYAFIQPATGQLVSTASLLNRHRPAQTLCLGPAERPIAVLEGSMVLERAPAGTWSRRDIPASLTTSTWNQCVWVSPGRTVMVGTASSVLEFQGTTFSRIDAGVQGDGGLVNFVAAHANATGVYAIGPVSSTATRVLLLRPDGSSTVRTAPGELVSMSSVPNSTFFVGPSGIGFFESDGGIKVDPPPNSANPGTTRAVMGAVLLADAGTVAFAVGESGALWKRPSIGGFVVLQQATQNEDYNQVWVSPRGGEAFIVGRKAVGTSATRDPAVFRLKATGLPMTVDPVPFTSRGPVAVFGTLDAGFVSVFVSGDQGVILRKDFPTDGG